ncbi:cilia- and flagella-associated protein 43 isoform X1 [Onthophagus taurus]|uniref:cilia- and flagella-associated protein 43 isoform X1 n=1 Tax=Onthophagus taurus TaxID=166361 RepID=UPI0039BE62C8
MVRINLNFSKTQSSWVKFGVINNMCFVGRDVVGVGDGCYIAFYNLSTKEDIVYTAIDDDHGHGVKCICGHKTSTLFAFGEKGLHAGIYVVRYPDFEIQAVLPPSDDGLLCMTFCEGNYIVSLGDLPTFELCVWNWKTLEKLATCRTDIFVAKQLLRSSYGAPTYLAQMSINERFLNIWDVLICGKRCLINQHKVVPFIYHQQFAAVQFTSEGAIFVQDVLGDIYMVNTEYKLDLVIQWGAVGNYRCSLTWYKGGILANGPDSELRHYKKSGNWICDWKIKLTVPVIKVLASIRDNLIALNEYDDILYFDNHLNDFVTLREHESFFNDFCILYPVGEIIVTMARNQEITAWEVSTGKMLDSMTLGGPALSIAENPNYPYFAVGFGHGMLQLFSMYKATTIKLLASFHLTRNSLSKVAFVESGMLLIAADMSIGEFFVIEGRPGSKMQIVATCCANRQIADFILVASQTCFRLFALNVTSDKFVAGNVITRFCVIRDKPCPNVKDYYIENNNLYTKLYANETPLRDRIFYAQPINSKSLHELEVRRGHDYARFTNKIHSKHQMRKIIYNFSANSIISYGYDGLVITMDKNFEFKYCIMIHHRLDGGIVKAYEDPLRSQVIALGRNNTLCCLNMTDIKVTEDQRNALRAKLDDEKMVTMFQMPTFGFLPKGDLAGKTWLEVEELKLYSDEFKKCEEQKSAIMKRFKLVKSELKKLLTKNQQGPENELLDIQDFNLDLEFKNQMIADNVIKCKETKIYLEALIVAQDNVSKWIKSYCWDPMKVPGKTIFGIFSAIDVENYTLLPDDKGQEQILNYIEQYRDIEKLMASCDIFEPWNPIDPDDLWEFTKKAPCIAKEQEEQTIMDDIDNDTDLVQEDADTYPSKETQAALMGSSTHQFVDLIPGHYDQRQIQTFYQSEYETLLLKAEEIKLMKYFNKEFDAVMAIKQRDMKNLLDRNARLRVIISELNFFTEQQTDIFVVDPVWDQKEEPDKILEVTDDEITITPYISPSQQAILDAEAAERERIRLLLLADDFKERALMRMMNGVLEIRWEDELRKDVPLPKCVIEKKPEEFKEDDLRAIRDYEEAVKFLESERLRYRRMLCAEYGQLGTSVRESVVKFNNRIGELLLEKIKVDAAIDAECLKIHRMRIINMKKIESNEKEKELLQAISNNDQLLEELQKLISTLPESISEINVVMDALHAKEKLLEKVFRRDIQDVSPAAQEVAIKLYKKRPKTNLKTITTAYVLQELARCVVTKGRSAVLGTEALEFLRAMDNMDLYVGIPNAVDEHLYEVVCKNRRLKIESELKIRGTSLDIAEAESTVAAYQNMLLKKKEYGRQLQSDLATLRNDRLNAAENMELQLMIKQGYVELIQTGSISDFSDAILICRKDVEDINDIILKGGNRKLKVMRDGMAFRRGILAMEWTHKKMKMQITDLEHYLKEIEAVQVTKDVQQYLRAKARGDSPDKGITFEQEVQLVKRSFERIIEERRQQVREIQKKIVSIRKNSKIIDKQISDINVDVCEQNLIIDREVLEKEKEVVQQRTNALIKRTKLIKQIQSNHNEILVLQTELELLRLKTYPTLKYKIFE